MMETGFGKFEVYPSELCFNHQSKEVKFWIKNMSCKSGYFEVGVPLNNHVKLISPRTFYLAPGMSKTCKVKHENCKSENNEFVIITVGSSLKGK